MKIDWSKMKTAEQIADEERQAMVPLEVMRWQGTKLLKRLSLWDSIILAYESMPDGEAKDDMQVALFDTITWKRSSPSVAAMASVLGVTDYEVDSWFIEAATYEV